MADLVIVPVLALGVILGLYELILIHSDESFQGSHWFGHGIHSVGVMIVVLFFIMNMETLYTLTGILNWGWPEWLTNIWTVRIIIGLFLNIKMHATSAAFQGKLGVRSPAEHWTHTTLITALVITAPVYWPILAQFLPSWAGGISAAPAQ